MCSNWMIAANGSRNLIPAMVTFLRDFVLGKDGDDEWLREIGGHQRTKYNRYGGMFELEKRTTETFQNKMHGRRSRSYSRAENCYAWFS